MKKFLSVFLSFVMFLSVFTGTGFYALAGTTITVKGREGNITISNLNTEYASKVKSFLSDSRWKHGTSWGQRAPKLSTYNSLGCCAYVADFAKYVYGYNNPNGKTSHTSISNIKSGDILYFPTKPHYIVVLKRNGNTLITAEGAYGNGIVNVSNSEYTIKSNIIYQFGKSYTSTVKVAHYNDVDDNNNSSSSFVSVTFNGSGGTSSLSKLTVTKGGKMGDNIPTATRNGYSFEGWYYGNTKYSGETIINSSITLTAKWSVNNKNVLESGHVYRIVNYNSGMALQSNGSGNGALVRQQPTSNNNLQLWKISEADSNGYYRFKNAYGGRVLDIKGGSKNLRTQFQVYNDTGSNNQSFSLIYRKTVSGKKLFSIHTKSTGRALDILSSSKNAGAQLQQYYYHGGNNQLFYFEEVTNRNVQFYDNLSNNYLPTPREVYSYSGGSTPKDCYISRNTDYITTSINGPRNMLIITAKKAGSSGNDMIFKTTINGSYNYDLYNSNTNTMYLGFTAKSSVQGAKIYFRWGYDSTSSYKSVTLSTTETNYLIQLPRTVDSGSNIHPYVDRACTIQMSNIQLKTGSSSVVDLSKWDTYSCQSRTYNINSNNETYGSLPKPKNIKDGYDFAGWYTDRVNGTKVTENTKLGYNTKLYAHWTKKAISGAPENYDIIGTGNSGSLLYLDWDDIYDADGYRVYIVSGDKEYFKGTTKDSQFKFTDLTPGWNYTVMVVAYNDKGKAASKTTICAAPAPIEKVNAKSYDSIIKASWDKQTCTGYVVQWSMDKTFTRIAGTKYIDKPWNTTYKNPANYPQNYYVRVRAYKTYNGMTAYGDFSKPFKAVPMQVPGTPGGFKTISYSDGGKSLTLDWNGMIDVLGYRVYIISGDKQYYKGTTKDSKFKFNDLVPGWNYKVMVVAFNEKGATASKTQIRASK